MIEVGVIIAKDSSVIHWHQPNNASSGALPDSRGLWDIIWENRDNIGGIAHVHPWIGEAWPSDTDLSTFAAVELGLGHRLAWWVVTLNMISYTCWTETDGYKTVDMHDILNGISWVTELRARSGSPVNVTTHKED